MSPALNVTPRLVALVEGDCLRLGVLGVIPPPGWDVCDWNAGKVGLIGANLKENCNILLVY